MIVYFFIKSLLKIKTLIEYLPGKFLVEVLVPGQYHVQTGSRPILRDRSRVIRDGDQVLRCHINAE